MSTRHTLDYHREIYEICRRAQLENPELAETGEGREKLLTLMGEVLKGAGLVKENITRPGLRWRVTDSAYVWRERGDKNAPLLCLEHRTYDYLWPPVGQTLTGRYKGKEYTILIVKDKTALAKRRIKIIKGGDKDSRDALYSTPSGAAKAATLPDRIYKDEWGNLQERSVSSVSKGWHFWGWGRDGLIHPDTAGAEGEDDEVVEITLPLPAHYPADGTGQLMAQLQAQIDQTRDQLDRLELVAKNMAVEPNSQQLEEYYRRRLNEEFEVRLGGQVLYPKSTSKDG